MAALPNDPRHSANAPASPADNSTRPSVYPESVSTNTFPDTTPTASVTEDGIVVPGYEIRGELKRGGMGVVFAAYQLALKREVAIKTLRLDRPFDARASRRFLTESLITAKLQHPAVPPVFEAGQFSDDRPFLIMKLIRGEDLDDLLKERPTLTADLPRFLFIFEQICQAVGYAHAREIIHRDLKPANVMVGEFGEVQVMDWGIARELQHAEHETPDEDHAADLNSPPPTGEARNPGSELTQAGTAMGTPAYMAPEQARGEWDKVDARADVFALGGILSDILTGQPPFVADTGQLTVVMAAAGKVNCAFDRLEQCGADTELIALAKQCLQPQREDRPADGKAVADAVAAYRAGVETRLRNAETARAAAAVKAEEARLRTAVEMQAKQAAEDRALAESQAKQAAEERADEAIHRMKAEEAKVTEQRKRRRTEQWLATTIGLLLASAGAFAWWRDSQITQRAAEQKEAAANAKAEEAHRQKAEAEQNAAFAKLEAEQNLVIQKAENERHATITRTRAGINAALKLAAELRTQHKFREASEALSQAESLALAGGADDLKPAIQHEKGNLEFSRELDRIHARKWAWISTPDGHDGHFATSTAATAYAAAFAAHGLDITNANPATIAKMIANSPLKTELLRSLDDWAIDEPNATIVAKVLAVAHAATPDEKIANLLRDPAIRSDRVRLMALLKNSDEITSSVPATLVAATLLQRHGEDPSRLLAIAQTKHPADFDLSFSLALWYHTRNPERAIGYYRAARAIHPRHSAVLTNLGLLLSEAGETSAAIAVLKEAVRLHPNEHVAHFNLGGVLVKQNKLTEAEVAYREAIKLSPKYTAAYNKLGVVLNRQQKYDEAVMVLTKAIELAPKSASAHYSLGVALEAKKDLPGAHKEYREAARLNPKKYGDLIKRLPPEK